MQKRFQSHRALELELLEARQLLAADLISMGNVGDPFARDAVKLDDVVHRAEKQSYVAGELLIAVELRAADPNIQTVAEPTWHHLVGSESRTLNTLMDFATGDSTRFQLMHVDLGAGADVVQAMRQLDSSHDVLWTQPNFIHEGPDPREYTPNDPQYANQYHHTLIGNDVAWDTTFGDSDIVIGVTDDGVDLQHEDLSASIWTNVGETPGDGVDNDGNGYVDDVNGWNFLNNNNNPDAVGSNDHGTHVAGIAAGITDNGIGIAGTAGGATIMPLKWYDGGTWTAAIIAETFTYAADNGVDIVNTSYNMDGWASDAVVHAAFDYMYDNGVLHFNSAGNGNSLNPPRQVFEQTLLVASTTSSDTRSGFSNYGDGIDVASPGSDVLSSTPNNNYEFFSGTSMASPNAAGVAALIWSQNPTWSREQVVAQMMATTDNIDAVNGSFVGLLGAGRVNSGRGVSEAVAAPQVASVTGIPEDGTATSADSIDDFRVVFNQHMDAASVLDSASYELRDAGLDGVFDTLDDGIHPLTLTTTEYLVGTNGIDLDVATGPLGFGDYRFSIVSGGAENPFSMALDGNGDGTGGDDYQAFFSVTIEDFVRTGIQGSFGAVSGGNIGSLTSATDADGFNFFAESGESVTAVIRPFDVGAKLTAEFVGLGSPVTAVNAGDTIVVPLSAVTSDGNVTINVSSDLATSYQFDIYRNVNVEALASDGLTIDIDDSYVDLGSGRTAAVGQASGTVAGIQFIQTNDPSQFIDISATGTPLGLGDDGESTITSTVGNTAFPAGPVTIGNNGGIIAAAGEDLSTGNTSLPSSSWDTALLPMWDDIDSDTGDVYWEERLVDGINTLIVQWHERPRFSNIGSATFQVQVFESGPVLARFAYQDVDFGDPTYNGGASATIGYQASTSEAYEFSVNSDALAAGDVIDLINGTSTNDVDEFSFTGLAGNAVDVALEGVSGSFAGALLELLDPNGMVVATGTTDYAGANVQTADQVIADYVVVDSGAHTVRLTTDQTATYSLLVTDDLLFDMEPNGTLSQARSLDNAGGALGFLNSGSASHSQFNDASLFVDISGSGAALGLGDDGEATINSTINNAIIPAGPVTIGNNGAILAGGGLDVPYINTSLPSGDFTSGLFPFWDDIDSDGGNVYWEETQVNGVDALVVQWDQRPHFSNVGASTFQVQLLAEGPVAARFVYQDVDFGDSSFDNGASATIGVQLGPTSGYIVSQDDASVFDGDVIDISLQEDDLYSFSGVAGEAVSLGTATPFDNPNSRPTNGLDPKLTVLDADGNELVSDQNSAADGKNALLEFTPDADGTYFVAVSGESGTGDYVLSVGQDTIIDGDFNGDGAYDCIDVNLLTVAVVDGTNNPDFDLTGDGLVNLDDRDAWLAEAGAANGLPGPYLVGDVNLDGTVDGQDFIVWNSNRFTVNAAYCSGDINMDGVVDGSDFVEWNTNRFQSSGLLAESPVDSLTQSETVVNVPTASVGDAARIEARREAHEVDAMFAEYGSRGHELEDDATQRNEGKLETSIRPFA